MNLPGAPRQNCLLLKLSVTSTTPGMCLGGVWTRMACEVMSSLHTSMVPNSTWMPSKKLSPMMMTVEPPVVQPSLGEIAFITGMAELGYSPG